MTKTVEKVIHDAMELPLPYRAFIAERLLESLDCEEAPPLSSKWKAEIRRRCDEIDRGAATLHPMDMVFNKAYSLVSR